LIARALDLQILDEGAAADDADRDDSAAVDAVHDESAAGLEAGAAMRLARGVKGGAEDGGAHAAAEPGREGAVAEHVADLAAGLDADHRRRKPRRAQKVRGRKEAKGRIEARQLRHAGFAAKRSIDLAALEPQDRAGIVHPRRR